MGRSGLAGGKPLFSGDALTHVSVGCRVQSLCSLLHSGGGDFPARSPGLVATGIGGSIPRSDVLFLTLEMNSLGFRALTCLIFMMKVMPSFFQSCCACRFLCWGLYKCVSSYLHSKEVSRNHKYMYTYTYIKDIYENEIISIRNTASVIELFLRILFFLS